MTFKKNLLIQNTWSGFILSKRNTCVFNIKPDPTFDFIVSQYKTQSVSWIHVMISNTQLKTEDKKVFQKGITLCSVITKERRTLLTAISFDDPVKLLCSPKAIYFFSCCHYVLSIYAINNPQINNSIFLYQDKIWARVFS